MSREYTLGRRVEVRRSLVDLTCECGMRNMLTRTWQEPTGDGVALRCNWCQRIHMVPAELAPPGAGACPFPAVVIDYREEPYP